MALKRLFREQPTRLDVSRYLEIISEEMADTNIGVKIEMDVLNKLLSKRTIYFLLASIRK